ncbi:MAG TPA: toll/interleukin-1 receptor domain-containing protein, partial [Sphingomicrobium sp.]|nr:toll/interleukin-1 receptor domain-containing protein [Sphingomicrobium sp.]
MARVFLSYDREDEEKARLLAGAIEKAGHSVWWDRHIRSGAQYSKEIEQALRTADALVVLWSKRSVDSPWVRDEAAAGRDSGRLIPVRLDSNEPPLGFRQFQTIDLSRWKGRGKPAQLPTLLADIDALATGSSATPPAAPVPAERPARRRPTRRLVAVALLIAALLVAGLVAWRLIGKPSPIPLVAVAATETSPASTALARDLFVQLGRLQATNADA